MTPLQSCDCDSDNAIFLTIEELEQLAAEARQLYQEEQQRGGER